VGEYGYSKLFPSISPSFSCYGAAFLSVNEEHTTEYSLDEDVLVTFKFLLKNYYVTKPFNRFS
jgi:hypothetical protein